MYIKQIIIDGFKSYGQRTEVSGFDPAFNAITGLNGSGKSNILDSICFLLGITNLTHVRATNLQELVYKNGQAGITKATVTITFDNSDKKQSPLGYEHYDEVSITRQVVIGGKNKYLINGTNIQNNRVKDFFQSVQLNVNNPHFLIMQGRITKVLNMKPPEILSMIEEAAGTMMYESKKQQAQKTIMKKDSKLREINDLLNEEITPTLSRLKEERSTYLEFQKIQRELEHLTKLYIAYKFVSAEKAAEETEESLEKINQELTDIKQKIQDGVGEMNAIAERIEALHRARDQELGGLVEAAEADLETKEKSLVTVESSLKATRDNAKQEQKKCSTIKKGMISDTKDFDAKTNEFKGMREMYDKLREEDERAKIALKNAQARYEAISVGKFTSGEEGGKAETLQGQIIRLKAEASDAVTTVKANQIKIGHNEKEIKRLDGELRKISTDSKKDNANLKKFEDQVAATQKELQSLDYEDGLAEQLEEQQRALKHEVQGQARRVDQMSARFPWLDFHYSDPVRGFDRSQVKGVAANLIDVKDAKYFSALDTAGGGKLTNVIVTRSEAAGQILKNGRLARRTVFLPLDKMSARCITTQELKTAQKIVGKDNVHRAIDLIEFDPELVKAMEYIFGGVLVCANLDVANKLAFDKSVGKLCVTLDGDKVNPSGELSGGAAPTSGSMLTQIAQIKLASSTLEEAKAKLDRIEARLKTVGPITNRYNQLKHQLQLRTNDLEALRERLSHTDHHRLATELEEAKTQLAALKEESENAKKVEVEATKKVKDLESKVKNTKALKEKELKDAEAEVKKCKKDVAVSQKQWSDKEREEASLKMELEELTKSIAEAQDQIKACDDAIKGFQQEVQNLEEKLIECRDAVQEAKEAVRSQKDAMAKNNREINAENAASDKIKKKNDERGLKAQEMEHKIAKASDDARDAKKTVEHMLDKYEWISIDRQFFGEAGSAYDFKATDPKEAAKKIQKLEATKEKLEGSVNMRAMTMLDKAEAQYNDLMKKKLTVENDKEKITKVIEELDRKKKEEVKIAYEKVNKDFGSIFSTLLPGTQAKLKPPDGQDVLDGLEVKIAFGDVWKESLSELSGGQRSLVALSLILSLLLFKPAPLYILDEVDAALDLSHTQNIGRMLKTHFKHSQFIVVSLKDGMFNNANVLFRTKFVDGMSTVTRTAQREDKK